MVVEKNSAAANAVMIIDIFISKLLKTILSSSYNTSVKPCPGRYAPTQFPLRSDDESCDASLRRLRARCEAGVSKCNLISRGKGRPGFAKRQRPERGSIAQRRCAERIKKAGARGAN